MAATDSHSPSQPGDRPRRLVIACGGTGGHLFPGIAVAEAWQRRGGKATLIISEKQIDALATEGYDHLAFERQQSIAMPRIYSPRMIGFAMKFVKCWWQSRSLIRKSKADAVLGMGGFTSTAPLVAGRMQRLPTFIHESNAIPGRANLLNARFSSKVLVGFEACSSHFGATSSVVQVGTPLRPALIGDPDPEMAREKMGLKPGLRTLLIMGGSQGAQRLNEIVGESLQHLPADRVQVLHLSGPRDYEMVKAFHDKSPEALHTVVLPFCAEMQWPLAAADLSLCRSGASTLTELAAFGIPSVLVPYPFAAHDHQTRNAEVFVDAGGALLWPQDTLTPEGFAGKVSEILGDEATLQKMGQAMSSLHHAGASEAICDLIEELVEKKASA